MYRRVLPFDDVPVEVAIRQTISRSAPLLNICLTAERLRPEFKHEAKALVEKMFGLQVDLAPFYQMAVGIQNSRLVEKFRGVKPPRFPAIFERLANAYACQQLSLTVGLGLLSRLARLRFEPDAKGWNPLRFSSPTGSAESYTDSIPRARLQ